MIGCWPTGTMGLGIFSEYSRIRVPRPPQKSTTFMFDAPRIDIGQLGHRNDVFAAPCAHMLHLLHDLQLEIPGQDEEIVRLRLIHRGGRQDRYMRARRELTVLVDVAVD